MRLLRLMGFLVGLALPISVSADIVVEVETVGFRGDGSETYVYRGGAFAPVAIKITAENEPEKTVFIHIEQNDIDGDIIFSQQLETVTSTEQGAARTNWLYFTPNPETGTNAQGLKIQLLDEDGDALQIRHDGEIKRKINIINLPGVVDESHMLILHINDQGAGKVRRLSDTANPEESYFFKPIRISTISPDQVPDHWHGLEMVDAIIWDNAQPLGTQLQEQALLDWVQHGGRLLIASAGQEALELSVSTNSVLGDALPVTVTGTRAVQALPTKLLMGDWRSLSKSEDDEDQETTFVKPFAVAECTTIERAQSLVGRPGTNETYLATRSFGDGSITFLSLRLRDLYSESDAIPKQFIQEIFAVRKAEKKEADDVNNYYYGSTAIDLFAHVHQPINFERKTAVYLLIAILFIIAYGLLATWGSWFALKAKNMLKHSWLAFVVVVIAASLFSLLAVQWTQGFGRELHQLTIVDTTVNTYSASAHGYFGVKTSSYVEDLDLWLRPDLDDSAAPQRSPLYLRPLSPHVGYGGASFQRRFSDTRRYEMQSTRASVLDLPIRATLKQLEGYWRGRIDGQFSADIKVSSTALRVIEEGSSITNGLAHDLVDCYLIQKSREHVGEGRDTYIFVHPLGKIAAGETVDISLRLQLQSGADTYERTEHNLKTAQREWADGLRGSLTASLRGAFLSDPFRNIPAPQKAIMLATTFDEFVPFSKSNQQFAQNEIQLLQFGCRWLDCTKSIREDQMLLVGFADDPDSSPVLLHGRRGSRDYTPMKPSKSLTAYRVRIPVQESSSR